MLLTDEGHQRIAEIAQRHGFSPEAAQTLLAALVAGNGNQAQFNHPELGGMGQWSMGGMLMIGDMFNSGLKFRVDGLAQELSAIVGSIAQLQPPRTAATGWFSQSSIWPEDLGAPTSSGAQNDMQYAVFPAHRRLAVMRGGRLFLYDTGDHLIGGVSQQQGGGNGLSFTSQYGPVSLDSLTDVTGVDPVPVPVVPEPQPAAPAQMPEPVPQSVPDPVVATDDGAIFAKIEQLHGLFTRGILTQTEFDTKKAELLGRL